MRIQDPKIPINHDVYAYLNGVWRGDASFTGYKKHNLRLTVTSKDFADEFALNLRKIGFKVSKFETHRKLNSFGYFHDIHYFNSGATLSDEAIKRIQNQNYFNYTETQKKQWLKGLFEAEGNICLYNPNQREKSYWKVGFTNQDLSLLLLTQKFLESLNIKVSNIYGTDQRGKPRYDLIIYRQDEVRRFVELFSSWKFKKYLG